MPVIKNTFPTNNHTAVSGRFSTIIGAIGIAKKAASTLKAGAKHVKFPDLLKRAPFAIVKA